MTINDKNPRYPKGPGAAVRKFTTRQQSAGDQTPDRGFSSTFNKLRAC